MDKEKLKNILEALLFVTHRPISLPELSEIIGETQEEIRSAIQEMKLELQNRKSALHVAEIAEGYQLTTNEGYQYWVKKLFRDKLGFRLSQSAMETLSIVAYKQPITRAEIEEIRGVEVIGVLETLIERRLSKVVGRKETVGRPLLYGTTQEFLRHFGLWKISELPSLEDLMKEAERRKMIETGQPQENNGGGNEKLSLEQSADASSESTDQVKGAG
jgi:segregation and condensation protein B